MAPIRGGSFLAVLNSISSNAYLLTVQSRTYNDKFQEEGRREGVSWVTRTRQQPRRCLSVLWRIQPLICDYSGPVWLALLSQDLSLLWYTCKVMPGAFSQRHWACPGSIRGGQLFKLWRYTRIFLSGSSHTVLSIKQKLSFRGCCFFIFCCLNNHLLYCWEKLKAVSFCGLRSLANSTPPLPFAAPSAYNLMLCMF